MYQFTLLAPQNKPALGFFQGNSGTCGLQCSTPSCRHGRHVPALTSTWAPRATHPALYKYSSLGYQGIYYQQLIKHQSFFYHGRPQSYSTSHGSTEAPAGWVRLVLLPSPSSTFTLPKGYYKFCPFLLILFFQTFAFHSKIHPPPAQTKKFFFSHLSLFCV